MLTKQGVQVPRPLNVLSGLTSCTAADTSAASKGDTDDYDALKWTTSTLATIPSMQPGMPFGSMGQNLFGHRSMMGLQVGNLNLVGPMAYAQGNDQKLVN